MTSEENYLNTVYFSLRYQIPRDLYVDYFWNYLKLETHQLVININVSCNYLISRPGKVVSPILNLSSTTTCFPLLSVDVVSLKETGFYRIVKVINLSSFLERKGVSWIDLLMCILWVMTKQLSLWMRHDDESSSVTPSVLFTSYYFRHFSSSPLYTNSIRYCFDVYYSPTDHTVLWAL